LSDRPLTLVTGASRGIGLAVACALADTGHDLVLVSRTDAARLDAAAEAMRARGAACDGHLCDISDADAVQALFGRIDGERLSGVVNNAGAPGARARLQDLPIEELDRVLAVNVRGTILVCRAAMATMAGSGGSIVNLSSQTAQFGGDGLSVYAAAKAAVNGLTVSLAREAAPMGVRVNAVSPGPVLTEPLRAVAAARLEQMQSSLPMGRFCTAEEVADVVVWLLSPKASYVSGAIIPIHGAR
jgi:NAD(P)-dependent dehydrogenase (short-subunit alcohol dehydrogenase family)